MIRTQYYFRQSDAGLLAWDVKNLICLSEYFAVKTVDPRDISELDEPHWYSHEGDSPSCRSLLKHFHLIEEADLSFPIILDESGRVMDGMHRICKAVYQGLDQINAVQFDINPEPDFVGCDPRTLP